MTEETASSLMPVRIAFIIDGVVQDVLNTDDRLAAIFLSNPKIVDVSEVSESEFITSGYLYNEETNTFIRFSVEEISIPSSDVTEPIEVSPDIIDE